jgi:hypothetical protein
VNANTAANTRNSLRLPLDFAVLIGTRPAMSNFHRKTASAAILLLGQVQQ